MAWSALTNALAQVQLATRRWPRAFYAPALLKEAATELAARRRQSGLAPCPHPADTGEITTEAAFVLDEIVAAENRTSAATPLTLDDQIDLLCAVTLELDHALGVTGEVRVAPQIDLGQSATIVYARREETPTWSHEHARGLQLVLIRARAHGAWAWDVQAWPPGPQYCGGSIIAHAPNADAPADVAMVLAELLGGVRRI